MIYKKLYFSLARSDRVFKRSAAVAWHEHRLHLPCPAGELHQNHKAPGIKGARPAVRVSACYLFYRPRTVGKKTVESSECQKSWGGKQQLTPETTSLGYCMAPRTRMYCIACKILICTFIFLNKCALCQCISPLCMIYSNI